MMIPNLFQIYSTVLIAPPASKGHFSAPLCHPPSPCLAITVSSEVSALSDPVCKSSRCKSRDNSASFKMAAAVCRPVCLKTALLKAVNRRFCGPRNGLFFTRKFSSNLSANESTENSTESSSGRLILALNQSVGDLDSATCHVRIR